MKEGTSLPSWLTVSSAGRFVRGLTSRAESNRSVGSLNRSLSVLSACSASPLTHEAWLAESSNDSESIFRSRDGKAPSEKETEGSASEAADVETRRFGLSTAPSAAAESAFPEGSLPARADGWLRSEASPPRSASRTVAAGTFSSPRLVSGAFYRSHKWNN